MRFCISRCGVATAWCDHYDAVQTCTIVLLYLQVACALVGSLGAIYTGIVLANLALALFALIAIESGSQNLGRAYAWLLALSLLLDIVWFSLFTNEIRLPILLSAEVSVGGTAMVLRAKARHQRMRANFNAHCDMKSRSELGKTR